MPFHRCAHAGLGRFVVINDAGQVGIAALATKIQHDLCDTLLRAGAAHRGLSDYSPRHSVIVPGHRDTRLALISCDMRYERTDEQNRKRGRNLMDLQINFDSQRAMLTPGRVVVAETGNNQHQHFTGRHARRCRSLGH
jgi:hypothetical protein